MNLPDAQGWPADFLAVLDAISEGFCAVDVQGATTCCNAAFLTLFAYGSASEVIGRRLFALLPELPDAGAGMQGLASRLQQAALTGEAASAAAEMLWRQDGTSFPADYRVRPIWRNGQLEGAFCILHDVSERLQARQARQAHEQAASELRETHDQLRLAEEAGGIGTFLLNIGSSQMVASAEFFRIFGLPVAHRLNAAMIENLVCSGQAGAVSSHAKHGDGQPPAHVEYRINKASTGELRWISRQAEFVHDETGRRVWMRGVVQDITERKLAEATLQESESRFRLLAQALPNQVWTATPEGRLDWVNQRSVEYAGLPAAQLLGEGWLQLVHPEDLERVSAQWRNALKYRTSYEIEFRLLRHDGHYRWHLVRALPDRRKGSRGWLGASTDIEEQKAAQAELAQLNASLETRVEERTRDRDRMWRLSTDLMLVAQFDGRINSVNPAWQRLLGWNEHELVGTPLELLVHEGDRAHTLDELEKLRQGQTTERFENRYRHKDGSFKTISWIAVPDGERLHAVGRDVSAERAAALALKEAEERLRQSQKMEAIGQLTGGIAHDFNNLLQGISGAMEVVRGRLASGRTEGIDYFMDSALHSTRRAGALIHRLLAFARRQSLQSKAVDVNGLVRSMEELMRRTLGGHIELVVDLGADAWMAQSDDNQLESALLNLAVNARDAMPEGGRLTLKTFNTCLEPGYTALHEGLRPGDYVAISVSDTGTGMPPDVLARVFEPFFTTKPIGQGTGLGLSMIYGFAKQSGGHVRIHSQVGHGTHVCLYLPRHAGADQLPPAGETVAPSRLLGEGETLLVVEDDPAVRAIVLDELQDLGYATLEAMDGPTALPILQSSVRIDLMISDVGLPGLNGRQIAEIGRQHRPNLPVLFMTGYAQTAAVRSEFLAPGMEMISKPFSMDEMAAKIRTILQRQTPPAPLPLAESN